MGFRNAHTEAIAYSHNDSPEPYTRPDSPELTHSIRSIISAWFNRHIMFRKPPKRRMRTMKTAKLPAHSYKPDYPLLPYPSYHRTAPLSPPTSDISENKAAVQLAGTDDNVFDKRTNITTIYCDNC